MKVVINPDYAHLKPLIDNIEKYFQASTEILYNQRNQIRVVSYDANANESKKVNCEEYVVKSFKIPNALNRIVYRYFRSSKAKRSYQYSLKIGKEFCPEPVAFLEDRAGGLLGKSYFVSKRYRYDFTIRPVLLDKDFDKSLKIKVL